MSLMRARGCRAAGRSVVMVVMVVTAVTGVKMYFRLPSTDDPSSISFRNSKNHTANAKPGQPFIPDRPEDARPGQPADIPRRFLLEEVDACRREEGEGAVQVVAYVHSAISRVQQRRQTRLTWANTTAHNPALRMVVVFMVGRAKDDKEREIVRRESDLYHDIVQGDYADHYHLLSYKALSAFYWITRNCAHVPWTLHSDDDLVIDTFRLRELIQDLEDSPDRDQLQCRRMTVKVLRQGKWKVSVEEFAEEKYPPYCLGPMWFVATEQVRKLLKESYSVNYLWVDDVYVTGLLANQASIGISNIGKFIVGGKYKTDDIGKNVAWFHLKKNDRVELWDHILEHYNNVTSLPLPAPPTTDRDPDRTIPTQ